MPVLRDTRHDGRHGRASADGDGAVSVAVRFASHQQLGPSSLRLWVLEADDDVHPDLLSQLDRDELRRAASLRRGHDRARYVLAHAALREFLGHWLEVPPSAIDYVRQPCPVCGGPNGRPAVDRPSAPVHFSLSTRGHLIVIAVATTPVGVDVEVLPTTRTAAQVGELLHPAERAELLEADPGRRAMVFGALWTRKEAYLKGLGVGVAHGLGTEYVGTGPEGRAPRGWEWQEVPVPALHAAALAVRTAADPV